MNCFEDVIEVPEITPYKNLDARISGIEQELRMKEAQLKRTGSIVKKLQIMREIKDRKSLLKLFRQVNHKLMNDLEIR